MLFFPLLYSYTFSLDKQLALELQPKNSFGESEADERNLTSQKVCLKSHLSIYCHSNKQLRETSLIINESFALLVSNEEGTVDECQQYTLAERNERIPK